MHAKEVRKEGRSNKVSIMIEFPVFNPGGVNAHANK